MSPPAALARNPKLPWLVLLFIGSGCAALIYEVVWLQLLQLVIGLTTVSLGVLLGSYMGGMCLGSLLLARLVSASRHPLRVYAALELGIGLIGVAVLFIIPWLSSAYTLVGGPGWVGIACRAILAAICLVPPTVLMGATLPAISRWVETTPRGVAWLGFFYGGNLVGAVIGCLAAGFYLLRLFDVATATYVAAALNFVVAAAAWLLARNTSPAPTPSAETPNEPTPGRSSNQRAIFAVAALSGLTALGAEVVWTRLLSLMFGGTVYTFSIILAVFLVGLGLGSTVAAHLARSTQRPRLLLGTCQLLLTAGIAWAGFMATRSLPHWPVDPSISLSPYFTFQLDIVRCLWVVLPASCLWGASFPLALAVVSSGRGDPGRVVGRLYAANTVGAIVGSLAFSVLIVPTIGSQWAQRILILLAGLSALIAFGRLLFPAKASEVRAANSVSGSQRLVASSPTIGRAVRFAAALGIVALTVGLGQLVAPTPWGLIAYGRFMATYGKRLAPTVVEESKVPSSGSPEIFPIYVGEGLNGSVAVTRMTSGVRNFHSAGKVQASSEPQDMRLQRMLGHLSALLARHPESVLVVACGAGVTAGSFVVHPEVKRIVICDIEPLVPKFVAPLFAKENHNVIADARTQVVADDGRHFIRTTREKFDVITSDPIDPWVKGCAALNTLEYFQMCKAHLKPGGVMSLWIPLYESDSETVKSSVATFFQVFPNGALFSNDELGEGYDAVLIGQLDPEPIQLDALNERMNSEEYAGVKRSMREAGFQTLYGLFGTYAGQASDMRDWLADAQLNTDRNLRLQYLAGMAHNRYVASHILDEMTQKRAFPENLFAGSPGQVRALRFAIMGSETETSN